MASAATHIRSWLSFIYCPTATPKLLFSISALCKRSGSSIIPKWISQPCITFHTALYLPSPALVPTQAKAHWIWLHCSSLFLLPAIASRWGLATMAPFIPAWKVQRVAMESLSQEPSFLQAWKGPHSSWAHSSTVLTWECFQRVIKNSVKKLLMTPKLVFPLPGKWWESAQMWNNGFRMLKPTFLLRWRVTDGPQKKPKTILGKKISSLSWHI